MSDFSESSRPAPSDEANLRIDQIAEAALWLFARYGYKRSSMDDIAREAGLAKATLYLHFKGKDDVFRAMLDLLRRRVEARCREVLAGRGAFPVRLAGLLDAYYGQAFASFGTGEHLVELKALTAAIASPQLQALEQGFRGFAQELCAQARAAGEIAPSLEGSVLDEWIAALMFAATGAKAGEAPSCETYAVRLASIARIFAAAASAGSP